MTENLIPMYSGLYYYYLILFFYWAILWSSETSDHLQEDLAKFGYKPVMKVENLNKPFIFSLLNLVISVIYLFRNLASESQFVHKNPLHVSKSYFSGPEKSENSLFPKN
jgi:hypothetical protein